jgi:hypothetical protein
MAALNSPSVGLPFKFSLTGKDINILQMLEKQAVSQGL